MRGVYVVLCKLNLTLLIDLFCLDVHIFGSGHRKQAPSFSFFLFQFLSSLKQCIQTGFATMILKAAFLSNTNMFYKPKAKKQKTKCETRRERKLRLKTRSCKSFKLLLVLCPQFLLPNPSSHWLQSTLFLAPACWTCGNLSPSSLVEV